MADDTQIEGLPEGATVKPLQTEEETAPPQPTGDKSSIEGLPAGATVRALPPAPPEKSMAGAGGSFDAPSSTASKVWEAANKPLVPEGRAEKEGKEYAESAPTLKESEHPYLTGAAKGLAGGYADTLGFVRGLTSPIGVAAMGLGALGEVPGAMGKIAKPASRIAAGGFGAQGAQQAVEGGMNIAKEGITPENIKQTLGGAGMAALGTAGTMHGTEMGEAPAQKTLAAPIRAASKLGKPLSHVVPSVGGIIAASEMGIPHPFIVGGTLGRFALPPAYLESIFEKGRTLGLNPEEAQITRLQERYDDAVKAAKQPEKDYKAHQAGREQGIPAPDDVLKAHEKAQTALQSAKEHLAAAQDDYSAKLAGKAAPPDQDITPDAVAAARPEAPTPTNEELNTRQNALMGKIEKQVGIGVPPAENVKVPGQVQPETFPQEPTEAPRVTMGRTELAGGKGTMGNPRLLTEGVPDRPEPMAEGTPNRPEPIGEVLPPEKPAKPGRMGKLKVNDKGIVVDTEDPLQQKIEEGLQGVPKAVATPAPKAEVTVPKSEKTLGEREAALLEKMRAVSKSEIPEKTTVTGHELGVAPIETKAEDVGAKVRAEAPPMPRGERRASVRTPEENEATEMFRQARKDLGDDATNEQIDARIAEIKAGKATGKIGEAPSEESKGSPEDRTMVEHTINELPNQELQNLGAKYGLSTSTKDYDFSKREPLREGGSKHPVDRNRFHKDLMAKLPQGLADAIAKESKAWDEKNPHTFDPASRSSKWRADRAKEILEKAQEAWSAGKSKPSMKTARMSNEELLNNGYTQDQIDKGDHLPTAGGGAPDTVGTKEGAEKDTDHFAQAKKELPNGTLSEQLGRAQELKSRKPQEDIFDKGGVVEPEKDVKAEDKDHEKSKKMTKDEPKPKKTWTPTDASGMWSIY